MPTVTKKVVLTNAYQLVGTANASQFAGQALGGVTNLVFGDTTPPAAGADALEWTGTMALALPGSTSIWVKGTGVFTAMFSQA